MTITLDPSSFGWGILGVILIVGLLFLFWVWRFIARYGRASNGDRAEVRERWKRVEALSNANDESTLRHAVIEADNVFDLGMKLKFFAGKDFGGRLKHATAQYRTLRTIWGPHKLRNQLVHETGTRLSTYQAKRAIAVYRDGLKELGLL